MSSTVVIILIALAVLVLGLIAFLIIRRQRYIQAPRERGWTFESHVAAGDLCFAFLRDLKGERWPVGK
jgi:preprotein translocase subunit YajC